MLFNSIEFLIFFPVVTVIYFILPHKARAAFLLAASCYFYMSFIPKFLLILAITTVIEYFAALLIHKYRERTKLRRAIFAATIIFNILTISWFKYLGFFGDTINFFGNMIGLKTIVLPEIILPIGISFYTFQAMGYLIDVYKGNDEPERDFVTFSVFLMFFPQLVAGPMQRARNIINQFKVKHTLSYENISLGGRMMLWGMFKKVVVADNLSIYADSVFSDVHSMGPSALWLGTLFFAVQIYCDFSGYSDIAIGTAKIMGFDLMRNFDTPYFSSSIPEFWRRWHISLSSWFRDYIYIPLGGNRVSKPRWCLNQLITFSISGIWHGASWTFVLWGLLNGIYLVLSRLTTDIRNKIKSVTRYDKIPILPKLIAVAVTFYITCLTWVFFRADTFGDAFFVLGKLLTYIPDFSRVIDFFPGIPESRMIISLGAIALLFLIDLLNRGSDFKTMMKKIPMPVRILMYSMLLTVIVLFGAYDNKSFIYFQF